MRKLFSPGNLLIIVLLLIAVFVWRKVYETYNIPPVNESNNLKITFLNVGQGDSILISTPSGKNILMDGGTYPREWSKFDAGRLIVVPYLKKHGIEKLDIVVATHPDLDHIGGLLAVLNKYPVDLFLDSGTISTTKTYEDLLTLIDEKKIKYKIAEKETINLEPGLSMKILSPISKGFGADPNNNSIVIKLEYGNIAVLLTGDIAEMAETLYAEQYKDGLKANILKAAHHGSNSSSSRMFLDYVQPEIAIISVGKNSPFGHPGKDVMDRLENRKIDIYRTDKQGHITITTDGKDYKIYTQY